MTTPVAAVVACVEAVASAQRDNAGTLRKVVLAARAAGATWRELGDATGLQHPTLYRQIMSGSPVVVVRAYHTAPGEGTSDG